MGSKIYRCLPAPVWAQYVSVLAACYVTGARLGSKILPVLAGTRLGSIRVGACRMLRHRSPRGLQFYRCLPAPAGVRSPHTMFVRCLFDITRCHPLIEISLPLSSCPTPQLLPLLQGIKASVRNSGGHKTWVHLRAEITVAFELAETLNLDRERQVLKDALIRGKHMMLALSSKGSSDANAVADIMTVFTKALPNPHGVPEAVLLADLDTLKLVRKLNGNKNNASRSVTAAAAPSTYAPTPLAAAAPVSSYAYPGPAAVPLSLIHI